MPKGSVFDHNEIRRIAITAVFSDDYFFERVVLKGGNALAIALGISSRTSIDLDFSIETTLKIWKKQHTEFTDGDLDQIEK